MSSSCMHTISSRSGHSISGKRVMHKNRSKNVSLTLFRLSLLIREVNAVASSTYHDLLLSCEEESNFEIQRLFPFMPSSPFQGMHAVIDHRLSLSLSSVIARYIGVVLHMLPLVH